MIYGIYCVKDEKTGFMTPTIDLNDPSAYRNFEHAIISTRSSLMFTHKNDFALYKLGSFDSVTGEVTVDDKKLIVDGSSIVIEKE